MIRHTSLFSSNIILLFSFPYLRKPVSFHEGLQCFSKNGQNDSCRIVGLIIIWTKLQFLKLYTGGLWHNRLLILKASQLHKKENSFPPCDSHSTCSQVLYWPLHCSNPLYPVFRSIFYIWYIFLVFVDFPVRTNFLRRKVCEIIIINSTLEDDDTIAGDYADCVDSHIRCLLRYKNGLYR